MSSNGVVPANGNANQQAAVNGLLERDSNNGRVAVHQFDPDATPAEKAASAGKSRDKLKSANDQPGAGEQGMFGSRSRLPSCCHASAATF